MFQQRFRAQLSEREARRKLDVQGGWRYTVEPRTWLMLATYTLALTYTALCVYTVLVFGKR